jgi:hypothetical protein
MADHHEGQEPDEEAGRAADHAHHHGASAGQFLNNWSSYEGSFAEKLWLAVRNRTLSHASGSRLCCGHPGQPGC